MLVKMHVIIICFGFVFLLFAGEAKSDVYHDLGSSHIDSSQIALAQTNHKNDTFTGNVTILFLSPPKVLVQTDTSFAEETFPPAFNLLTQFPSRASPV
jgi:hypothetical protein